VDRSLKRLANSGELKIVLTALKNEFIQELIGTAPDEANVREECYAKIMTLDDLQLWVDNHANS